MLKILFVMNSLVIIAALLFLGRATKHFRNDEYDKNFIKWILRGCSISGTSIIIGAILFVPTFFPM